MKLLPTGVAGEDSCLQINFNKGTPSGASSNIDIASQVTQSLDASTLAEMNNILSSVNLNNFDFSSMFSNIDLSSTFNNNFDLNSMFNSVDLSNTFNSVDLNNFDLSNTFDSSSLNNFDFSSTWNNDSLNNFDFSSSFDSSSFDSSFDLNS